MLKDIAVTGSHHEGAGQFYYTRSAFDLAVDHGLLALACMPPGPKDVWGDDLTIAYVIGPADTEYCKIGITNNVHDRLSGLQVGCWDRLVVHRSIFVYDGRAYDVEQAAIGIARLRGIETRGEWVALPADKACCLLLEAAEIVRADVGNLDAVRETFKDKIHSRAQSLRTRERVAKAEKFARLGY